jgi:hypothetical protein
MLRVVPVFRMDGSPMKDELELLCGWRFDLGLGLGLGLN